VATDRAFFSPSPALSCLCLPLALSATSCICWRCLATAIPTGILLWFLLLKSSGEVTVSHLVTMVVDTLVSWRPLGGDDVIDDDVINLGDDAIKSVGSCRDESLTRDPFKEESPLLLLPLPLKNESLVGENGPPPKNELQPLLAVLSLRLLGRWTAAPQLKVLGADSGPGSIPLPLPKGPLFPVPAAFPVRTEMG